MNPESLERSVTIRFSHIDRAGTVFYPRYFELLSELFDDLPIAAAPFAMQTEYLKPNYLGDEIGISFARGDSRLKPLLQEWSFEGRMNGTEHFAVRSLPPDEAQLDASAHRPGQSAFRSEAVSIAPWTTDCSGNLQASRFFELVNYAVEQWFPRTLGMTFHELHTVRGCGIPTVTMRTRCRKLPRAGETVTMWVRPTDIGNRSLTYTCWLVRGDECLLENEQVVVFVKVNGREFETIPIPDTIRAGLEEQHVAA